jgi:hypothetical protein
MRAKLQAIKQELRRRTHQPIPVQGVVTGYLNYHAVPTNVGRWLPSVALLPNSGSTRSGAAVRRAV